MFRPLLVGAALVAALVPVGGAANASCDSAVIAFFYSSSRAPAYHYPSVVCEASGAGAEVDGHIVQPGATTVQGRFTAGNPGGVFGCIVGLGANSCTTWTFATGTLGSGTNDSKATAITPTATGTLSVWVPNVDSGRRYHTIDQI